jgi:hypothetical protein
MSQNMEPIGRNRKLLLESKGDVLQLKIPHIVHKLVYSKIALSR